jgi:hypothetical protein
VHNVAAARLATYEGNLYRLIPVVATTANSNTADRTFIALGGTRRPWKG